MCSGCAVIDEDCLAAEQRARVLIDRHYALPDSCYGGADTLSDARSDYLQARAFALDVQEAQVPSSIEHIEVHVRDDLWARMMREDHQASRLLGVNTVSALFRDDPALTAPMDRATTADADVITIISEPTDTVGWVQDQMSAHDSVWLAVKHGGDVCWFAVYGDAADGVDRTEMKTLGFHGLTRGTTIAELFSTLHGHHAVHPGGGARALVAA